MIINILEYLEKWSKEIPDQISYADKDDAYTYFKLCQASKSIGSYLLENNLGGRAVLVYMKKGAKNIAAFYGAVYAGGFYVPIDSKMPAERIDKIIAAVDPAVIICDSTTSAKVSKLTYTGAVAVFDDIENFTISQERLDIVRENAIDTDPIYVLFTSGSTGIPKGVVVCHRSVIAYAEWLVDTFDFNHETVFANQTPFYFSMSVLDIYATLAAGASLHVVPKMLFGFPLKLIEYVNEIKANTMYWVPSALCIVANMDTLSYIDMPNIKKILFAGETMPTKQLNYLRKKLPGVLFANLFGPTEITDIGIYYVCDRDFADDEPIPIGRKCRNVGALVIDDEGNQVLEPNKQGELYIRGSFVTMGYYGNEEKTKEMFVQNPANKAYPEIVYKSGDLVYYNERGEMMYAGRKDHQIKHMGNRIELGEIEAAISAQDGVDSCCCIYDSVNDYIIGVFSGKAEEMYLREQLTHKLPNYMLPNKYIKLDRMPINDNGKIDRVKLNQEYCG